MPDGNHAFARGLLIRLDRKDVYFLGSHSIAFAVVNLRHIIQQ